MTNARAVPLPERPKLRPINASPIQRVGMEFLRLEDPSRITDASVEIPRELLPVLYLADGTRTPLTIKGALLFQGIILDVNKITALLCQLDEALLLENGQFVKAKAEKLNSYRERPFRTMSHAGSVYPRNATSMGAYIEESLESLEDQADVQIESNDLEGIISPHIDYGRGHMTYARLWKQASQNLSDIDQIIVLGTDHNGGIGSITPTKQSYATPFGTLATNEDAVDEIASVLGSPDIFNDELHHLSEHSIELSLVWAHYFMRDRNLTVVPILCGSFQNFVVEGKDPYLDQDVEKTVNILNEIRKQRRTLVIAAGDLAHVGPQFGDEVSYGDEELAVLASKDHNTLSTIDRVDARKFFELSIKESDSRRICGLSCIYLLLRLLEGCKGKTVSYEQCPADQKGSSIVSIAGSLLYTE